jgi:PAS domain S-box-containing protein
MAEPHARTDLPAFLRGGGATGALIARRDWAATPLGPMRDWPQSLKTATALMLQAPLPMVLMYGKDAVILYNDAYAELIGRRHPDSLGTKARESWPEVAHVTDEAVEAGLAGRSLVFRDLDLVVFRTGKREQVWMNIDSSPVLDERGRPFAVLNVVIDMTERVLAERRLALETDRLRRMLEQAPGFIALLSGPEHVVTFVNAAHKRLFGERKVGRPMIEVFPELIGQGVPEVPDRVYATGERDVARAARAVLTKGPGESLEEHFLDMVLEPLTGPDGKVSGIFVEGFEVTDQVRAQAAAEESQRRLSAAITIARLGAFDWDLETHKAALDDRARDIFGFPPDESLTIEEVIERIDPADRARLRAAHADSETARRTRRELEFGIRLPDGSPRTIVSIADGVWGPDGRVTRIVGVFDDVTERRRAENRQRLLINELNHRVKNTLATVQSIAAQSLRSVSDVGRARDAFESRLIALAAAHDLLTAQSWNGARLSDVVAAASSPFETVRRPQISRSGPSVWLTAQQALALSLALHELATNAAKYGALSEPDGQVTIRWRRAAGELILSWVEQGGPPVKPPTRSGFGTRLLQQPRQRTARRSRLHLRARRRAVRNPLPPQ